MFWTQKTRPRTRAEGLLVEQVNDEIVVFDTLSRAAHCLSPLAAIVFEHCNGRTSLEDLAAVASERLGETIDTAAIEETLAQLDERELLDEDPGITRRGMIGKTAAVGGAAFAAPLITSVLAPTAASAASATCGGPPPKPTVLCCPCTTGSGTNKDNCCYIPSVTNNCQCVKAEGNSTKFCKPSANPAQGTIACTTQFVPPCQQCCNNQPAGGACGAMNSGPGGNCNATGLGYWGIDLSGNSEFTGCDCCPP